MKKIFLIITVIITMCSVSYTQITYYSISGYVVDEASVGVKGVLLGLYNSDYSFSTGTITSDTGYYEFTNLPSGDDYTIYPVFLPSEDVDVTVNPSILEFGEVEAGQSKTLPLEISVSPSIVKIKSIIPTRIDIMSLNSNLENQNFTMVTLSDMPPYVFIISMYEWIEIEPITFIGSSSTVNVTVNNSILNKKEGNHSGIIDIMVLSSTDTAQVIVNVTATCVLTCPNPYNPSAGNLTFFGDGIVPGKTTIRIYSLGGELVKTLGGQASLSLRVGATLVSRSTELTWDGTNEAGNPVTNGIYIYTYESPKEKGVGKFTVIHK